MPRDGTGLGGEGLDLVRSGAYTGPVEWHVDDRVDVSKRLLHGVTGDWKREMIPLRRRRRTRGWGLSHLTQGSCPPTENFSSSFPTHCNSPFIVADLHASHAPPISLYSLTAPSSSLSKGVIKAKNSSRLATDAAGSTLSRTPSKSGRFE